MQVGFEVIFYLHSSKIGFFYCVSASRTAHIVSCVSEVNIYLVQV